MIDYNTLIITLGLCFIIGLLVLLNKSVWFLSLVTLLIGVYVFYGVIIDPTIIMGYVNNSGVPVAIEQTISEFRIICIIALIWNFTTAILSFEVNI